MGLRVAHLIESDGPGGAERVVAQLAMALQASGASNVVFLPADGEGWLARELEGSGVTIEYFRFDRPVSPDVRALAGSGVSPASRSRSPTATSSRWPCTAPGPHGVPAIPHVITMHGGRYYADRLRRRLAMRAAIALSGRTVAVSSRLARQIGRDLWIPSSRIATIANGVRFVPPERPTLREELRLGPHDRLLVSVGNLYPVKGHQHLIDALALLSGRHPTLHLAIGGRGELADALATRARHKGVAGRVHLLGLRADVPAVLAAADVFVLPSLSEGLPLALLEAMFAGRPIVATDVGEVSVALAHGEAGVLVEAGNPPALAAALDRLLSDPEHARDLGQRAAGRALAEYDISHMVRRYVGTYEELLGRRANVLARSWGVGADLGRPRAEQAPPLREGL